MLAVRRQRSDRGRPQRVARIPAAGARRRAVVHLVDDQHVIAPRDLRMRRQHLPQQPHPQLALQPIDRHDQPRKVRKRVRANPGHKPPIARLTERTNLLGTYT